jgi:RNA polymerase sigma factor (sigma-70 family)
MPTSVIEHLRRAVLLRDGAGLGDGELLGRFVERHDEAALAALVLRHGPMVWGTCRRLLSHHDAEDAFQATFLVLARKAASVVPREMVGNWLYGVAHRTALHARRTAARRGAREVQVNHVPDAEAARDQWADVRPLLDQELSRLPDDYRAVLVLCDLEGRTRKEVARQLGVPEGTVAGRLARARAMLAERLTRRGFVASGGTLAAMLSQSMAPAGVPNGVVSSTIKAASVYAAGQAATSDVISAKVAALTEGTLKTMPVSKLKFATAVLLVAAVLGGAAGLICQTQAGDQPKALRGKKDEKPAAKKGEKPRSVKEQLQGTWTIVSTVEDGEKLKDGAEEVGEWSVKGATIKVKSQPKNMKGGTTTAYLRYRLDEKASPTGIDFVEGKADDLFDVAALDKRLDDADERREGVVSIKGDVLTICYSQKKGDRPTALESKSESEYVLIVLKRKAPKAEKKGE